MAARDAIEAYKSSQEYRDEKITFSQPIFDRAITFAWERFAKCYAALDLSFLDKDTKDEAEAGERSQDPVEDPNTQSI